TEHACGDRTAGDARDPVELREVAELVEPPDRADVEDHGALPAAGEAKAAARFDSSRLVRLDRRGCRLLQLFWLCHLAASVSVAPAWLHGRKAEVGLPKEAAHG